MYCLLTFTICCLTCLYSPLFAGIEDHFNKIENKTDGHSYGLIDYIYVINLDHRTEKYEETTEELEPYGIEPFRFSAVNGWEIPNSVIQELGVVYDHSMHGNGMGTVYRWVDGKEYQSHELIKEEGTTYFCHCTSRGVMGCLMSHLSILQDAYDSGYEIIWIMEDDVEVVKDPSILAMCIEELDSNVGRENWDILFTDRDYRLNDGSYLLAYGADYRPNVDISNQEKYNVDRVVSPHVRQMGSRFGSHSMIWSRGGIRKYLDFIKKYKLFLPIDMDYYLPAKIKLYSVQEDVVTNRLNSLSDNGTNTTKVQAEL